MRRSFTGFAGKLPSSFHKEFALPLLTLGWVPAAGNNQLKILPYWYSVELNTIVFAGRHFCCLHGALEHGNESRIRCRITVEFE